MITAKLNPSSYHLALFILGLVVFAATTCMRQVSENDEPQFDVTKSSRALSLVDVSDTTNPIRDSIDRANQFYTHWEDTVTIKSFLNWLYVHASGMDNDSLKAKIVPWMRYYVGDKYKDFLRSRNR